LESDHKITIHVEILLDDAVVRIEIQFGEIVGDHVASELWLLTPGNEFSSATLQLVGSLTQLMASKSGLKTDFFKLRFWLMQAGFALRLRD
jgi:hypothetical protein